MTDLAITFITSPRAVIPVLVVIALAILLTVALYRDVTR